MCEGVTVSQKLIPPELVRRHRLESRYQERESHPQFRFWFYDDPPRIPIQRGGKLQIVRLGNRDRQSLRLPEGCRIMLEEYQKGGWRWTRSELVGIPAWFGCDSGVWYPIYQAIRGLLVPDERGIAVCFLFSKTGDLHHRMQTGSHHAPVLASEPVKKLV